MSNMPTTINAVPTLRVNCSHCNLREHCVPLGLSLKDIDRLEDLVASRKRIRRGEPLFRAGDKFDCIGREQVTNFHMSGELLGLDGIANDVYSCDVVALEDTEVCMIPYERILAACNEIPDYSIHFQKILSREIVRQHGLMLLLGSMHAEERLAAFLLSLAQRFESRGYSRTEFVLRMTRAEIGSYLGLKLETVSRVLSRFGHDNLIAVNQKHVHIIDADGLRAIVSGQNPEMLQV